MATLEGCYDNIHDLFVLGDLNKDGHWERCEDAHFLWTMGNSKEYAVKYSHRLLEPLLEDRCKQLLNTQFGA